MLTDARLVEGRAVKARLGVIGKRIVAVFQHKQGNSPVRRLGALVGGDISGDVCRMDEISVH